MYLQRICYTFARTVGCWPCHSFECNDFRRGYPRKQSVAQLWRTACLPAYSDATGATLLTSYCFGNRILATAVSRYLRTGRHAVCPEKLPLFSFRIQSLHCGLADVDSPGQSQHHLVVVDTGCALAVQGTVQYLCFISGLPGRGCRVAGQGGNGVTLPGTGRPTPGRREAFTGVDLLSSWFLSDIPRGCA